jgi:hypothetical protein
MVLGGALATVGRTFVLMLVCVGKLVAHLPWSGAVLAV